MSTFNLRLSYSALTPLAPVQRDPARFATVPRTRNIARSCARVTDIVTYCLSVTIVNTSRFS